MREHPLLLAIFLALAVTFQLGAAEKPAKPQTNQTSNAKVWTNDDLDRLHDQGLVSIVGQEDQAPAAQVPSASVQVSYPVYGSRLDDPTWYAKQATVLQDLLNEREEALHEAQMAIEKAADRVTQPGVNLAEGNPGITPDSGIQVLQAQVEELQAKLDELGDLARQNGMPPGVLRVEPAA